MKKLIVALGLLLLASPAFAQTQPFNPSGSFGQNYAILPPPTTFYTDTTTALTATSTFTGTARALPTSTSARYFYASVYSDQGSAANGFQILGYNGTGYVVVAEVTTVAATPAILQVPLIYSSYKVQMINGTTAETTLWIQSGFAN